jgi:hypothetical protein
MPPRTAAATSAAAEAAAAAFDQLLEGSLLLSEAGVGDGAGSRFPDHVLPPRIAQARVRAMRVTDAQPRVNLASFVTTAVEPECLEVLEEALTVNRIDEEEYPSMALMRNQALLWLSDLWHAPPLKPGEQPAGADTVGSSEGVLLAGAAAKRRWQERRRAAGLPTDKPNIVLPTDAHVVWEKLTNFWEIEAKWGEFLSVVLVVLKRRRERKTIEAPSVPVFYPSASWMMFCFFTKR